MQPDLIAELVRADAETMRQAGIEVMALIRTHVAANPGLPTAWVARLILAEIPGTDDNNEAVAWAVREQITAMVREARGEDAAEVEALSDDPEVLLKEAAAMEAHADALRRYRETMNRDGGPADVA